MIPTVPQATATPEVRVPSYVRRGQAALRQISFDLASVGYTISFHPHGGSHRGLTFFQQRHIEIYVRDNISDRELAYVISHEIGHAVDLERNSSEDRARWRTARGIAQSTPWWPTDMGSDYSTPAGDFAECFATWVVGAPSHSAWGECGSVVGLVAELAR